ncbi:MAG: conjugal transfer protein TraN [Gammaproteobacteria bacterium]
MKAVFGVAKAAYAAYSTSLASGGTVASAASAGAAAGQAQALATLGPWGLVSAAVVFVVTEFILGSCSPADLETGMLNNSGYCYETGEYCKEDWFGFCAQRAKTMCCFNSKLARIVHEQGRSQLVSFATVPPQDCRGFTPEEFSRLDWSAMDLSEYLEDITKNVMDLPTVKVHIETKVDEFYEGYTP